MINLPSRWLGIKTRSWCTNSDAERAPCTRWPIHDRGHGRLARVPSGDLPSQRAEARRRGTASPGDVGSSWAEPYRPVAVYAIASGCGTGPRVCAVVRTIDHRGYTALTARPHRTAEGDAALADPQSMIDSSSCCFVGFVGVPSYLRPNRPYVSSLLRAQ